MGRWLVAFSPSHFFCPGQGAGPLVRGQLVPLGTRRQHPSPSGGLFSGRCYLKRYRRGREAPFTNWKIGIRLPLRAAQTGADVLERF